MTEAAIAAGWFDDPHGSGQLRWWDGAQWTDHVAPRPDAQPVLQAVPSLPAAVPALPETADAPALPSATAASTTATGRSVEMPPPRTLAIIGAALLLVIGAVIMGPKLLGGDDAKTSAATTTDAAATAPTGPPLSPQEYATQMRAISAESDAAGGDVDENSSPEQIRAAVTQIRAVIDKLKAINPPAEVATQHAQLVTQYEQAATAFEQLAANPKDKAAFGQFFGAALGIVGTVETIEKTLALDIDGQAPMGSQPAAA